MAQQLVQINEERSGSPSFLVDSRKELFKRRPLRQELKKSLQVFCQTWFVCEWEFFAVFFNEEIERVDHRQICGQIDFDTETICLLRNDKTRQKVAEWVLLPVQEMSVGKNLERIVWHGSTAVRRRSQADHLRSERNTAVILVLGEVPQYDSNCHQYTCLHNRWEATSSSGTISKNA